MHAMIRRVAVLGVAVMMGVGLAAGAHATGVAEAPAAVAKIGEEIPTFRGIGALAKPTTGEEIPSVRAKGSMGEEIPT